MQQRLSRLMPITIAIVGLTSLQQAPSGWIQEEPGLKSEPQESVELEMDKLSARRSDGNPSCRLALPATVGLCATLERSILDTTVRLEVSGPDGNGGWAGNIGHATVMEGRYLVTHNHFSVPFSTPERSAYPWAATVSLYRANGEKFLSGAPLTIFQIIAEGRESLVLDFGTDEEGRGFFEARGLASADFRVSQDLKVRPGVEVGQVNWDGQMAHVDWVLVEEVLNEGGTRVLVLSDDLLQGASGAGIFLQGYHIANNWKSGEVVDEGGSVVRQYSKAALNTYNLTAPDPVPFSTQ